MITSRGIHALTSLSADLAERVMRVTTRVDGRTLHQPDGSCVYQVRVRRLGVRQEPEMCERVRV